MVTLYRTIRANLLIFSLLFLLAHVIYAAAEEHYPFADPADAQAFYALLGELRCVVCQNESLADSQATIAHTLREQVYEMKQQGLDDEAIIEYLVIRYGDFILFKPRLNPKTYVLWFGPGMFLIIALLFMIKTLKFKRERQ